MTKEYLVDCIKTGGKAFLIMLGLMAGVILLISYCAMVPLEKEYSQEK